MTNEEFWVFSESLLAEDGSTKCPVMVSIQKSSKQRKKTVREDRNWLHLIFHSSKGFSVVFNWRKDMQVSPGRYLCMSCVSVTPLRVNGSAVWFHRHLGPDIQLYIQKEVPAGLEGLCSSTSFLRTFQIILDIFRQLNQTLGLHLPKWITSFLAPMQTFIQAPILRFLKSGPEYHPDSAA